VSTNPNEDMAYLQMEDTSFLSKAAITAWETDKTFSSDWAAANFFHWAELLHSLRNKPVRILEIGSWEGRSALFFLNYLPRSRITCIDTFGGSAEHHLDDHFSKLALKSEAQFDANLSQFTDRVEKIVGDSAKVLPELGVGGRRFDLAYVDGSHFAADVYRDALLTWSMVAPGGTVIFDDYEWGMMNSESERPKIGVDAFLVSVAGQFRELYRGFQVAIAKLDSAPRRRARPASTKVAAKTKSRRSGPRR
jgi:predicted O-methyltransferase YrrM